MEGLILSIQMACKTISTLVNRAGIHQLTGPEIASLAGDQGKGDGKRGRRKGKGGGLKGGEKQAKRSAKVNIQGEEVKKLDALSNDVLKNALRFTGKLGVLASEEEDEAVLIESALDSRYVAVFDPLDGSSNIDASICAGTIFGVLEDGTVDMKNEFLKSGGEREEMDPLYWDDPTASQLDNLETLLQPGKNLAASGYCMYSSSTILVFTLGGSNPVVGFTLDPQLGEFVLTHPNMIVPSRGSVYSLNEGNSHLWDAGIREYINKVKQGKGRSKKEYSARYIGSMVGDVHRTLLYGGIFGNPGDKKYPTGKLRLVYECSPMSFLVKQAGGGECTNEGKSILEVVPKGVHERCSCWLGSTDDIDELKTYLKGGDNAI